MFGWVVGSQRGLNLGFRRNSHAALESKRWTEFVTTHRELASRIGIPEDVYTDLRRFQYFLMHGDHPQSHFSLPQPPHMSKEQRGLVRELVLRYFSAGFEDPGAVVLPNHDLEELRAIADSTRS